MQSVVSDIGRLRAAGGAGKFVVECSPVNASQSNGVVERQILSVGAQVRVMKSALESRWGTHLPTRRPVLTWMVEYATHLLNRFEVGQDGKTAYERCKGKAARTYGLEFGEAVLWKRRKVGGALGKLTSLWGDGVFLGVKGKSGEFIIGDAKGCWRTRTVARKPVDERWTIASADMVVGVPWNQHDEDGKADGEVPATVVLRPDGTSIPEPLGEEEPVPRRAQIPSSRLGKDLGYTVGCPGCLHKMAGRKKAIEGARKLVDSG